MSQDGTRREEIGYDLSTGEYKQINYKGELLTVIKIGDSYIPMRGFRNINTAIKQGKKDMNSMNEDHDTHDVTVKADFEDKLYDIVENYTDKQLREVLYNPEVKKLLDGDLGLLVIQIVDGEKNYRAHIGFDEHAMSESVVQAVTPAVIADKIKFYEKLIPDGSMFARQTFIESISKIDVDLGNDSLSGLITEGTTNTANTAIADAEDSELREALSYIGHTSLPLTNLDKHYSELKETDELLHQKVDIFTQTKQKEKEARKYLSDYATDAEDALAHSCHTALILDNPDNNLDLYRDLVKKLRQKSIDLKLKDVDAEYLDTAIEEYHEWNTTTAGTVLVSQDTLLGQFILVEDLAEKIIKPVQEILEKELGDAIFYNPHLMEYHELRETPNELVLIKRQDVTLPYTFTFNVISLSEKEDTTDLSTATKLSAEQLEISDDDVVKAKMTLQHRINKDTEWVFDKNLNPELCDLIETHKFDIYYRGDLYTVLPKGKAQEMEAEKAQAKAHIAKENNEKD